MTDIQIFCLPFAGGNSYFFNGLRPCLDSRIELVGIDPKGHGLRMEETPSGTMKEMVQDTAEEIMRKKRNVPFALMGYSLGSNVCYYLYFHLFKEYGFIPKHIFFMANVPPYAEEDEPPLSGLDDDAFLAGLNAYGGLNREFLENRELRELYLPVLRADVAICENLTGERVRYLNCDFSVLYADSDDKNGKIAEWNQCALKGRSFYRMEGNHFFLQDNYENVARIVNDTLF